MKPPCFGRTHKLTQLKQPCCTTSEDQLAHEPCCGKPELAAGGTMKTKPKRLLKFVRLQVPSRVEISRAGKEFLLSDNEG